MKFALLSVLAMLGSAVAAPISLNKRSLPRLGGVNIAVRSRVALLFEAMSTSLLGMKH